MARPRIGVVREWKTDLERRAPLTPGDAARLIERGARVLVEPSPYRVFQDREYADAGATVTADLSSADLLVGIKEMPIERLHPRKPHLFFSHTIKAQPYNMGLLKAILDAECTLIDYELVTDEVGRRIIFFGVQAGQAGMINSLWMLGQRLLSLGFTTPLASIRQAKHYASLDEARSAIGRAGEALRRRGLPKGLPPLVIGITGTGNVSRGAQGILALLDPRRLSPEALLQGAANASSPVWQVVFSHKDTIVPIDPAMTYSRELFTDEPELFQNRFEDYVPHLSLLVTGHFWRPGDPRLLTEEYLRESFASTERPRLLGVGDITADIDGSIQCTVEVTEPDHPCYVYDPRDRSVTYGFDGPGLAVMAVDILPTEIARESSMAFGRFLSPYLMDVASADYRRPLEELGLPAPFQRAIIAHHGVLTELHEGLADHLPDEY